MAALSKKTNGRPFGLRVNLVGETEDQRAEVRAALAALGEPTLDINETSPETAVASTDTTDTDVTMVLFNGNDEASLRYLQGSTGPHPRPTVFALLHDRSADLMKRVLRAGADELLFLPLDPGDVTRALLKISEARRREDVHAGGNVISLVSLIGGIGVTSLAANLGLAMRYAFDKRVAVVDLDLQTGGLSVFLNLEPEHTITNLNDGAQKLDSIQLESALVKHSSGIYLLAAPKRIEDSETVADHTVGAAIDLMRQLFDYVIVDCGTHIDSNSVAAWERSQHLFYVLDQSIGAARCAWRFVDLCSRLGLPNLEPNFILSRYVANHPISEEQLSHTLAKEIFWKIPREEKVLERVQLSAQDLWQVAPSSTLAKSVEDLARAIESPAEVAAENPNSLVSRLLLAIGARA